MKLDAKNIRYLSQEDWRVLTAVEQGARNHEVVPTPLIVTLSSIRSGATSVHKCISSLAKPGLIGRVRNASYDGYRLTYGGLDYLALHSHRQSGAVYSVGNQIGVGKESDIYVVASPSGRRLVLKLHRLGRISFRTVKANRDYLRNRSSGSWMYMSRLAAMKEYAFMVALRDVGFPVPEPVAQNRHTIVMELIDAFPLRQIASVPDPAKLYAKLINLILRLARFGLIHGDFNEFNILISEVPVDAPAPSDPTTTEAPSDSPTPTPSSNPDTPPQIRLIPTLIDFPQMLSISHPNAESYFDRDVNCIKRFFAKRFHFTPDTPGPFFADAIKDAGRGSGVRRLDIEVEATGFSRKMAKELEGYMKEVGVDGDGEGDPGVGVEASVEEESDEDSDEEDYDVPEPEPQGTVAPETDLPELETLHITDAPNAGLPPIASLAPAMDAAPPPQRRGKAPSAKKTGGWAI
ncbi:RIO1-domain-containing protein [Trichodelitschia bisporula]|uniref:Serine/threonine-protein kinase RIO2 n=1 Tax=Trichodelitschia bisporula TaxID=703511 RepID=A0A6G1HKA2_9PEZI|nr:RIO1-domain-containing protein [Trichodelitschia bisporula]